MCFLTSDGGDGSTGRGTGKAKAGDGGQGRQGVFGVCGDEGGGAGCAEDTIIDGIFGPLVYGEGDGAHEGYACERRPYACDGTSAGARPMINGRRAHHDRSRAGLRSCRCAGRNR